MGFVCLFMMSSAFTQKMSETIQKQANIIDSLVRLINDNNTTQKRDIDSLQTINIQTEIKYKDQVNKFKQSQNELENLRKSFGPMMSIRQQKYYSVYQNDNWETVIIGKQHWMKENLNTITFRNGDTLLYAKTPEEWIAANENKQAAWCYFNDEPTNPEKMGKLYNWYAVCDPRGLAPIGWRVASQEDFEELANYLGINAGQKMKTKEHWLPFGCALCKSTTESDKNCEACKGKLDKSTIPYDGNGTNQSGFSGLPAEFRYESGEFHAWSKKSEFGRSGFWWCLNEQTIKMARNIELNHNSDQVDLYSTKEKGTGMSVRCVLE